MNRIVIAVVASFVLAPAVARAQATLVTFTTVDAVKTTYGRLAITGVKTGETAATTQEIYCTTSTSEPCSTFFANCERLALLAMTKPGQYLLKVIPGVGYNPECKLERVAP